MGYVFPRRKGLGTPRDWAPKGSWLADRRKLLKEQDRQYAEDRAEMDQDNKGKDPLWPEEQYENHSAR